MSSPGLYRAKPIAGGEMVKGCLVQKNSRAWIITEIETPKSIKCGGYLLCTAYEVIESTVGQATGEVDINKKDVFAGDIVKAWIYSDETPLELEIRWQDTAFVIDYPSADQDCVVLGSFMGSIEVIGTVHDKEPE